MIAKKPEWLRRVYDFGAVQSMDSLLNGLNLNTVCKEASCPNIGECWRHRTATFMILGSICTRNCRFCGVAKGQVAPPDPQEPEHVARAAAELGLKHVVVTSVTRDDLPDGGAAQFAVTIAALRQALPASTVEVLIPDLQGRCHDLDTVIDTAPDVLGHNIETVPALYATVRPQADYRRSLEVLRYTKERNPAVATKTGIMLGLGESRAEVEAVMDDLVGIHCDVLTIGQYLQPSRRHLEVKEYIPPEVFAEYKGIGERKGIPHVASAPLVRSSYHAAEALQAVEARP